MSNQQQSPSAAAGGFINEEEIPEIFHDLADEILPETHKGMEEIAEFLEKGAVDLLQKVENIPREHDIDLEKNPPTSAQEAAALPESVRLRRAIQALACVCRDARKDLVEISAKVEDVRDELDETLGEFEEELKKERSQRAQQVGRLQRKIEQARQQSPRGGNNQDHGGGDGNEEDQELIQELNEEIAVLRKQLSAEKQMRGQLAQDRADDAKRIRASAEATFQANTESLRHQVQTLRQQLDQRQQDDRTKGQNVNDMALLVAKMSNELTETKEQKDQLNEQLKVLMAEKASQPPPTREASIMEAEIQRLTTQLNEQNQRQETTIASLQKQLEETESSLKKQLDEAAAARDGAQVALGEAESTRDAIRKNVDSIRSEYQSMLESERKRHATALELATSEAVSTKKTLDQERNALRSAETKVFELSLQEERLTMEINALKVRLLHAEHETETANRRLQTHGSGGRTGSTSSSSQQHVDPENSNNISSLPPTDFSSLDAKELVKHVEGAYARNDQLQKALEDADKRIYTLQLQLESSRHSHKFEIDDAERRADEARKQLIHNEKQHQMMMDVASDKEANYLSRCIGTQATDPEIEELRADLQDVRNENENLQLQLEEAFEQSRVMRENLETKLTNQTNESEKTIQTLSADLRQTRFRFNKVQTRLNQIEGEHTTMSSEYESISDALQKADSQFRTAERELVDLNLENTNLRNKLKQMQREVEDLRLAMQMRERELELEYAENLKKLQNKIAKFSNGSIDTISSENNQNGSTSSRSLKQNNNNSNSSNNGSGSARRPLFQQLSPNEQAQEQEDLDSSTTNILLSPNSRQQSEKIRQLDELIFQIHGDTLEVDRQERATRDQHINTGQKIRAEIDAMEAKLANDPENLTLKAMIDEKKQQMVQVDTAMEKYLAQMNEKRQALAADNARVLAERKKMMS